MEYLFTLIISLVAIGSLSVVVGGGTQRRFDGDQVLRIQVAGTEQWDLVNAIIDAIIPMQSRDIWRVPSHSAPSADVFIPRQYVMAFTEELSRANLQSTVMIPDVQVLVDQELQGNDNRKRRRHRRDSMNDILGIFPTLEEIEDWMAYLNMTYPDMVHLINIGQTYHGRNLTVLKIGHRDIRRPAMWVDSMLHAREWVSPATNIYIIHQLLTNYETDDHIQFLLDELDWYFLVIVNPDGYVHSHTTNRMWRRNTRPITAICMGVDLNRNWDFMWGLLNASPYPCNDVYRGPSAASELEVQSMSRFLLDNNDVIMAYMSLHSFTQNWLTRWSYKDEPPEDSEWQMNISVRAVNAIKAVHGKDYGAGTAGDLLYKYSGGSADWARAVAGIKYSFLIELRDTGVYGFLLPVEEIIPTAEEAWAGIKVVAWEAINHSRTLNFSNGFTSPAATTKTETTTTGTTTLPDDIVDLFPAQDGRDVLSNGEMDLSLLPSGGNGADGTAFLKQPMKVLLATCAVLFLFYI